MSRRATRQSTAIIDALRRAGRPLSPQEILEMTEAAGASVSMATVYRQVKRLLDESSIRAVQLPGAPPRYEFVDEDCTCCEAEHQGPGAPEGPAHHHFFHCMACDALFPIEGCSGDVEQLAPADFTVERHEVVLYGRCNACGPADTNGVHPARD